MVFNEQHLADIAMAAGSSQPPEQMRPTCCAPCVVSRWLHFAALEGGNNGGDLFSLLYRGASSAIATH